MGLKILIFPASVIISLGVIIWGIYPGIMDVLAQREAEVTKQDELAAVENVEKNVMALSQSLNARRETESLVKRYYPETMDQERAVDMVNFLAQQSGVAVTSLKVTHDAKTAPRPTAAPSGDEATNAASAEASTQAAPEPPQLYKVEIGVVGLYEGIRGFFERLYRTDRLRTVESFEIREHKVTVQDGDTVSTEALEGALTVQFLYNPMRNAGNALKNPLFQSDRLEYSQANQLIDFINSPVSDLSVPTTGRTNPFQTLP